MAFRQYFKSINYLMKKGDKLATNCLKDPEDDLGLQTFPALMLPAASQKSLNNVFKKIKAKLKKVLLLHRTTTASSAIKALSIYNEKVLRAKCRNFWKKNDEI